MLISFGFFLPNRHISAAPEGTAPEIGMGV
jgi:hypothetical protein